MTGLTALVIIISAAVGFLLARWDHHRIHRYHR